MTFDINWSSLPKAKAGPEGGGGSSAVMEVDGDDGRLLFFYNASLKLV